MPIVVVLPVLLIGLIYFAIILMLIQKVNADERRTLMGPISSQWLFVQLGFGIGVYDAVRHIRGQTSR